MPVCPTSGQVPDGSTAEKDPALNDLPDRPASRILDEGRIFAFASEQYEQISSMLETAYKEHEIDIYIAATSFLLNETIEERAQALQEKWVSGTKGLVLCYVSGNEQMTFAATEDFQTFLSKFELMELFNQAAAHAKMYDAPPDRIQAATSWLVENLGATLAAKQEHKSFLHEDIVIVIGVLTLAVLVILGAGFAVARVQQRADTLGSEFYYFPRVIVGSRYGGTFGGGACALIDYKNGRPRREHAQTPESRSPFEV